MAAQGEAELGLQVADPADPGDGALGVQRLVAGRLARRGQQALLGVEVDGRGAHTGEADQVAHAVDGGRHGGDGRRLGRQVSSGT